MPALNLSVLENTHNLPWRLFVGNLGMTGQTAYYALKDVSDAKPVSLSLRHGCLSQSNQLLTRARQYSSPQLPARWACKRTYVVMIRTILISNTLIISLLVQLAHAKGMKVIASCGSDNKAELLRSLGATHVLNRKKDDINEALRKYGPIDIYIDNVGGQALEAAIENAAMNARIVICGAISTYNGPIDDAYGVRVS